MNVLILGSNGMAGHILYKYLKDKGYNVKTLARSNADFCINDITKSIQTFEEILDLNDYDFVINCIGLLVKDSNERPHDAIQVNAWLPHFIEKKLSKRKTKLIHLSTDCVFDGSKGNYIETDIHTEMNFYGRSKSLGEVNNNKDITFRMSIIGPELKENGSGLLNWILKNEEIVIPGWDNALWSGITTLELAKCIDVYMQNPAISGIYHITSKTGISKYDLLVKINKIFNLNKTIQKTNGPKSINKILIDTRKELEFNVSDYDTMLHELSLY